jgi:hypothetical protein
MRQINHSCRRDADLEAVDLALELVGDILAAVGARGGGKGEGCE